MRGSSYTNRKGQVGISITFTPEEAQAVAKGDKKAAASFKQVLAGLIRTAPGPVVSKAS